VDAVLKAARTSIGLRSGRPALALKVRALVQQLAALDRQIAELEAAIEREFSALGYCAAAFPVGTAVSLATRIAEAGDVHRFPSSTQFLDHFGWCPADSQSGQSRNPHPRLSKAGNRHARRLIWMLAVHAVSRPGPFQDYFQRRTAAGKHKMDTLVAVGRKLLAILYAILRTGRPYDPAFRSRGLSLPAAA
jgi:transposase